VLELWLCDGDDGGHKNYCGYSICIEKLIRPGESRKLVGVFELEWLC